eukprot:gene49515-60626_t
MWAESGLKCLDGIHQQMPHGHKRGCIACATSQAFVNDLLGVNKLANAVWPKLAAVTRLLDATTGQSGVGFYNAIHRNLPGLQFMDCTHGFA